MPAQQAAVHEDLSASNDHLGAVSAERAVVGAEVGIAAAVDYGMNAPMGFVIYRLVDERSLSEYRGPFMIDIDGVVRVAKDIHVTKEKEYSFMIEAISENGFTMLSEVQSVRVVPDQA
jgi:hypothetical protein